MQKGAKGNNLSFNKMLPVMSHLISWGMQKRQQVTCGDLSGRISKQLNVIM